MTTSHKNIAKELSSFPELETVPYFSRGWSMHQLIDYLLHLSGPADVFVSAFSISEPSMRTFLNLADDGLIQNLSFLFDFNIKRHKLGLLYFCSNITPKIYFDRCHAKTVFIINNQVRWCVLSSANLNENNKYECGTISRNPLFVDLAFLKYQAALLDALEMTKDEFIR